MQKGHCVKPFYILDGSGGFEHEYVRVRRKIQNSPTSRNKWLIKAKTMLIQASFSHFVVVVYYSGTLLATRKQRERELGTGFGGSDTNSGGIASAV